MKLTSKYVIRPLPNEAMELTKKRITDGEEWCRNVILARLQLDKIVDDLQGIEYEVYFDVVLNEITITATLTIHGSTLTIQPPIQ